MLRFARRLSTCYYSSSEKWDNVCERKTIQRIILGWLDGNKIYFPYLHHGCVLDNFGLAFCKSLPGMGGPTTRKLLPVFPFASLKPSCPIPDSVLHGRKMMMIRMGNICSQSCYPSKENKWGLGISWGVLPVTQRTNPCWSRRQKHVPIKLNFRETLRAARILFISEPLRLNTRFMFIAPILCLKTFSQTWGIFQDFMLTSERHRNPYHI